MKLSKRLLTAAVSFALIWMNIMPVAMADDQSADVTAGTNVSEEQNGSRFSDMEGHWAEAAVERLAEAGILNGYPDGSFKPQQNVSRAEVAKIISVAFDLKDQEALDYPDVDPNEWYYPYVVKAYPYMQIYGPYLVNPIADPFTDSYYKYQSADVKGFMPENQDLRMFLAETLSIVKAERDGTEIVFPEYETLHEELKANFIDAEIHDSLMDRGQVPENLSRMIKYAWASWKMGIFEGDENHWFGLIQPVTRAELAVTVDRVLNSSDSAQA